MLGTEYDSDTDPTVEKWAARASEWEKKIAEGRRKLELNAADGLMELPDDVGGGVQALHTITKARTNNVLGQGGSTIDIDTRKAMKLEIELMLGERLRKITNDIRDTIEKEWRIKLPELEYNMKEQYSDLVEKFDQEHRLIVNIGNKSIEATTNIETLKKDTRAVEVWKRDIDAKIRETYESLGEIREKDTMTRKHCEDLIKSREEVSRELQEVIRVKEDTRAAESRLESYIRDESRNVEKRIQLSIDGIDAKLHRLNTNICDDSETTRQLSIKLSTSEDTINSLKKDIAKQKSKLLRYSGELDDQGEEIDEIRTEIKQMLQTTTPGYCQGCRVLMNDVDTKLFQIKESICFLDKTINDPSKQNNASPPQTSSSSPSMTDVQQTIGRLEDKAAFMEDEITALRNTVGDLQIQLQQQQQQAQEIPDGDHVPEGVMKYVDDIAARIQDVVLTDVRDTLDHWGTSTARQADVDDIKHTIDDMNRRLDRLDDY